MLAYYTKSMLLVASISLLTACSSKKEVIETQPEELTPAETQNLSLSEQEALAINEDNVMNPFPG